MRRAASKSGACILTSLFFWPVAQLPRSPLTVSFGEQEIELSGGRVGLYLLGPGSIVLFQDERCKLRQFSWRQFTNSALNFREAHLVD